MAFSDKRLGPGDSMRVLLLLDGSAGAMDESLRLTVERNAELCALFVQDGGWREFTGNDWLSTSKSYTGFLEYVDSLENNEARCTVEHFLRRASAHGLKPRVKLVRGDISQEALNELKERATTSWSWPIHCVEAWSPCGAPANASSKEPPARSFWSRPKASPDAASSRCVSEKAIHGFLILSLAKSKLVLRR
ncbi:hypothetical protein DFAR_1540006 [Desulfarculales bacterium]